MQEITFTVVAHFLMGGRDKFSVWAKQKRGGNLFPVFFIELVDAMRSSGSLARNTGLMQIIPCFLSILFFTLLHWFLLVVCWTYRFLFDEWLKESQEAVYQSQALLWHVEPLGGTYTRTYTHIHTRTHAHARTHTVRTQSGLWPRPCCVYACVSLPPT